MRDDMPPRARSGNRLVARGPGVVWRMALASALVATGCLHSAAKTTDTGAPPPPATSTSTPSASTSTPAPAPSASSSPVPEFGTLPPPPPPPDPAPPAGSVGTSEGWTTPAQPSQSTPTAQTPGYRVQIFASSERTKAENAAADARQRFAEPVYVEFEAPLYKVRVGDCATRHEADTLKERAGALGYDGAWVAETQVRGH